MKFAQLLLLLSLLFSFKAIAIDEYDYDELLDKHLQSGHLTDDEVDHQKFELINSQRYQKEFSKQVRGVASKLNENKNVFHMVNPDIEIPAE